MINYGSARVESIGKLIMTRIYESLHKSGALENDLNFVLKYLDKEYEE